MRRRTALLLPLLWAAPAEAAEAAGGLVAGLVAGSVNVVAAQAHYADLTRQLGGALVQVTAAPIGPNQDPHSFEPGPSLGRAVAEARVIVMNGAGYDPWMTKLLLGPRGSRTVLNVAALLGRGPRDNPHLWFDPAAIPTVARAVADALIAADPANRDMITARHDTFIASLAPLDAAIAGLRTRFAGTPVAATEPVFGLMTAAIGLEMRHQRFQIAVMNETEPRASDVAAFEDDLRARRVRVLITNTQTSGGSAVRLVALARRAGVPVAEVRETMPAGLRYQDWLLSLVQGLGRALDTP